MSPPSSSNSNGSAYSMFVDFMAGGIAGITAKTICAPLERVKLLLQTQKDNAKLDPSKRYKGIVDCFVRCVTEEGTTSLWRGNMANIYRYFPTQAIAFGVKDQYNRIFNPYDHKKNPNKFFFGSLLSGGLAGATSMTFVYPLDFARTRLGVDLGKGLEDRQFRGLADCLAKIYKSDGLAGLYRGFGISVTGIFIYRAFYFGGYDAGKKLFFTQENQNDIPILHKFLFAQFITTTSETLSYPLDTIRRRLMMQSGRKEILYTSTMDCARKINQQEGVKGFFNGNLSNCWRSVGSSMVLVLYDEIKKYLAKADKKH